MSFLVENFRGGGGSRGGSYGGSRGGSYGGFRGGSYGGSRGEYVRSSNKYKKHYDYNHGHRHRRNRRYYSNNDYYGGGYGWSYGWGYPYYLDYDDYYIDYDIDYPVTTTYVNEDLIDVPINKNITTEEDNSNIESFNYPPYNDKQYIYTFVLVLVIIIAIFYYQKKS